MHKIDGPTAAIVAPTPMPGNGPGGYFSDGNPETSTPATIVDADWANAVQGELTNVIETAGMPLDKARHTQLLEALNLLFVPAGSGGVTLSNPGHIYLPGGLIIQWGSTPIPGGANASGGAITFPIPFPNAAFGIYGNADGRANSGWAAIVVIFDGLTNTGASFGADSANASQAITAGTRNVRWVALGH